MMYVPFHKYFPEIAENETRCLTLFNDPKLPAGSYGLFESYCSEPGCDCRRVFLSITSVEMKQILTVIAFGWESEQFYAEWMGDNDLESIKGLKGPCFNLSSPQSKLAPVLLEYVKNILEDKQYVNRIKRHYRLFKKAIESESVEKNYQR